MRKSAIDNFKRMELTGNELGNIFFPDKRIVCNTCHKIRIKTLISKYDFDEGHQNNICFCPNTQNRQRRNHHIEEDEEQQPEQNEEQKEELNEEQQPEQNEEQKEELNEEQNEELDEGEAQYVTRKEFNEFKEEINQKLNDIQDGFKTSFNEISKQIQDLKK